MRLSQKPYEVHHFATGGTIDSYWNPSKDTAVPNQETIIPHYFRKVRLPQHKCTSETFCLKDSREISIEEQDVIAASIAETSRRKILLTSGTYLMPDIGRAVLAHPAVKRFDTMGKRIVLTGSAIPMKGYQMSDGGFNLGMGVAVLQEETDALVTLAMSGMCLDVAKGVRKDLTRAVFYSSEGKHDTLKYNEFVLVPAGGSIDFELDGLDRLVPAESSSIPSYLRDNVQIQKEFNAINPCVKDSRDLKEEDFGVILDIVRESTVERILITLGIYKMRQMQEFLRKNLKRGDKNKKIIITGSRYPLTTNSLSDAPFNLGYALGKIGFVREGVHMVLNGMVLQDQDDYMKLIYNEEELRVLEEMGVVDA